MFRCHHQPTPPLPSLLPPSARLPSRCVPAHARLALCRRLLGLYISPAANFGGEVRCAAYSRVGASFLFEGATFSEQSGGGRLFRLLCSPQSNLIYAISPTSHPTCLIVLQLQTFALLLDHALDVSRCQPHGEDTPQSPLQLVTTTSLESAPRIEVHAT